MDKLIYLAIGICVLITSCKSPQLDECYYYDDGVYTHFTTPDLVAGSILNIATNENGRLLYNVYDGQTEATHCLNCDDNSIKVLDLLRGSRELSVDDDIAVISGGGAIYVYSADLDYSDYFVYPGSWYHLSWIPAQDRFCVLRHGGSHIYLINPYTGIATDSVAVSYPAKYPQVSPSYERLAYAQYWEGEYSIVLQSGVNWDDFQEHTIPDNVVYSLCWVNDTTLLIGTASQLYMINPEEHRMEEVYALDCYETAFNIERYTEGRVLVEIDRRNVPFLEDFFYREVYVFDLESRSMEQWNL